MMKFHCVRCDVDFDQDAKVNSNSGLYWGHHVCRQSEYESESSRCFPVGRNDSCRLCGQTQTLCVCPAKPYPHIYRIKSDNRVGVKSYLRGRMIADVREVESWQDPERVLDDMAQEISRQAEEILR